LRSGSRMGAAREGGSLEILLDLPIHDFLQDCLGLPEDRACSMRIARSRSSIAGSPRAVTAWAFRGSCLHG
jgi:hypothetical protein